MGSGHASCTRAAGSLSLGSLCWPPWSRHAAGLRPPPRAWPLTEDLPWPCTPWEWRVETQTNREEEGPGVCSAPGPSLGWSRPRGFPTQSAQLVQALWGARVNSSTVVSPHLPPPETPDLTASQRRVLAAGGQLSVGRQRRLLGDLLGLPLRLVVSLPPSPRWGLTRPHDARVPAGVCKALPAAPPPWVPLLFQRSVRQEEM